LTPSPSPGSSRRGSRGKCNRFPEPLHFACIDPDETDEERLRRLAIAASASYPSSRSPSLKSKKCNKYPEPLHFRCIVDPEFYHENIFCQCQYSINK
jgi:hypothetical protein